MLGENCGFTGRAACNRPGVTGSGLPGLAAPGPIPALIPYLSLPTVNAWELGEGYSVADSMPGRGGLLTVGLLGRSHMRTNSVTLPQLMWLAHIDVSL